MLGRVWRKQPSSEPCDVHACTPPLDARFQEAEVRPPSGHLRLAGTGRCHEVGCRHLRVSERSSGPGSTSSSPCARPHPSRFRPDPSLTRVASVARPPLCSPDDTPWEGGTLPGGLCLRLPTPAATRGLVRPPPPPRPTHLSPLPSSPTGTFKLSLTFTEEYPNVAPKVCFVSKLFHPNGKPAWTIALSQSASERTCALNFALNFTLWTLKGQCCAVAARSPPPSPPPVQFVEQFVELIVLSCLNCCLLLPV